jgi:hypothetical protein
MKNQVYPQRSNLVSKLSIGVDFKGIYFNAWFEISLVVSYSRSATSKVDTSGGKP